MDFIEIKEGNCNQFEPSIKGGALILFFSNGCHHCDEMKPEWNKLKQEIPRLNDILSGTNIVSVDANHANKLDEKWHRYASSVPTVISVDSYGNISDYNGQRQTEPLVEFMKEKLSTGKPQKGGKKSRRTKKKRDKKRGGTSKIRRKIAAKVAKRLKKSKRPKKAKRRKPARRSKKNSLDHRHYHHLSL